MEKFLNRFGLGTRILSQIVVPLLLIVGLTIAVSLQAFRASKEATDISRIVQFAPNMSRLIHELQKERGRSTAYLGTGGAAAEKSDLSDQRAEVDTSFSRYFRAYTEFPLENYDAQLSTRLSQANTMLRNLQETRVDVDSMTIGVAETVAFYSETIETLFVAMKGIALATTDAPITREFSALINLQVAKNFAGLQRTTGNLGYNNGVFTPDQLKNFYALTAAENAYTTMFKGFAPEAVQRFYNEKVTGNSVRSVEQMRAYVLKTNGLVGTDTYDGQRWFDEATNRINLMNDVVNFANDRILAATARLETQSNDYLTAVTAIVTIALIIVIAFSLVVFRSIARPMSVLEQKMTAISDGDLKTEVPYVEYGSSIGKLANSIAQLKSNSLQRIQLEKEAKETEERRLRDEELQREKDAEQLRREREKERKYAEEQIRKVEESEQITTDFEEQVTFLVKALSLAAEELDSTSRAMAQQAEENKKQSGQAVEASSQTDANVQTVAAASEELAASIAEIQRQVERSTTITAAADERATKAVDVAKDLQQSSETVGEIVELISTIAAQTNLLALNATIEAARAGDAGRGFAVVAHEVKELADQTARATEAIASQVGSIRTVSEEITEAVGTIKKAVTETAETSAAVAAAIEQQSAATAEIARNAQEAQSSTQEVAERLSSVHEVAERTQSSSINVAGSSNTLASQTSALQEQVSEFVSNINRVQQAEAA